MKFVFAGLCFTLCAGFALAHSGATGVVKARMDMMKDMGATMKALTEMSRSDAYDRDLVVRAGQEMQLHAAHMADMFPAGSDAKPSEAGPAIWTDRARFEALFAELGAAGEALEASAADSAALPARIADLGATCKDCHQGFRVKR